jgi:CheY-like chemotaxis protein
MARILLVEDNDMNRNMLRRALERDGHEVTTAADGAVAIATARSQLPDLIVMDLSLPEVDGWEATARLKADEATRHIPVIALTAHALASDREKALAAGCDEYDTKPVDLPVLMGKIQGLLDRAKPPPPRDPVRS